MHHLARFLILLFFASWTAEPLVAQLPFYTDDPSVTEPGKWHFEFYNEFDVLQLQYPNLRQNTANYKLNYGLPFNLELDVDVPYLAIFRVVGQPDAAGGGDTNLGVKWEFHKESGHSRLPALGASFYVEFPTGDASRQLGSGLIDYWLNLIAQKSLSDKSRVNGNAGYLFAGNTSTGVLGIQAARGHVYTGGFSLLHDFTARLTLGGEVYGGYTNNGDLGRTQLQVLIGGQYQVRRGMTFDFGMLGGKYVASPRIGAQVGFSVDFPDVMHNQAREQRSFTMF
ncbi:MAG TPA: transporter [Bryobacteraceae bacterium]|nr:transporter [Bryobacteraceae bacterium]